MANKIELKSISELLGMNFFIPSYQRGYRWTKQQVEDLLNDINNFQFEQIIGSEEETWYSLQPLVVKRKDEAWEVIDGQQRLTTIYLILRELSASSVLNMEISYETRKETKLKEITKASKPCNIDEYFMIEALETISKFRSNCKFDKGRFIDNLINHCKIIWYEVKEDEKEVFKRLNSGKISLSNAELVKALLLKKENFLNDSNDIISLKQLEIAGEWDRMEQFLNKKSFWFFINPEPESSKYEATHIDFILEYALRCRKNENEIADFDEEITKNPYFIFYILNKQIAEDIQGYKNGWNEIQATYRTIKSWYENRELYHYIGYLMNQKNENKQQILIDLLSIAKDKNKKDFIEELKTRCRRSLLKNKVEIILSELSYGNQNDSIHNVLLLFNLATIQKQDKENSRYPFDKHYESTKKGWSLEHIHAQKEQQAKWTKEDVGYIKTSLLLISTDKNRETLKELSDKLSDELDKELCKVVVGCFMGYDAKQNEDGTFYTDFEKDDSLKNIALLQGNKNSQLNNKMYFEKRRIIAEYEQGENNDINFLPVCTRNVFFKHYSTSSVNPLMWDEKDGNDYLNAIINTTAKYLDMEILISDSENDENNKIGLKLKEETNNE